VTDSWTDSNGGNIPSDWTPGGPLTPADEWAGSCGCAPADGPSIADSVVITGSPGTVTSVQNGKSLWSLVLNDGTPAADFRIDRFDDTGALADSPMTIVRATGVVSFNDPVMLAEDPVEPLEAATKQYVDENAAGIPDAPDNQTYGRTDGAWNLVVPASGGTFTGQTNLAAGGAVTGGALLFAGNAVCSLPTVAQLQIGGGSLGQVPATDGAGNLSWVTPVTGGPYLPIAGGTVTGSLTVNQVLTVQGSNSLVLNAPVTGGNQRSIMGMASNVVRWILTLGDQTAEGVGNAGSNFGLAAYSTTGAFLGNWLTIARADGSTTFNGSGVTIAGGLAVNGLLALASLNNLAIYGGAAGQVLSTNGSGILSWINPGLADAPSDGQYYARHNAAWAVAPGGMTDAPNDGTAYARKSLAWAHLTHTDITDWTATLAPYALTTAVPVASSTLPLASGVAAVGTSAAYARADHVHPVDANPHDNRIINGNFAINQRVYASGTALPAAPVTAAYGHDRWKAGASGCTYTFTAAVPDTTVTITVGTLTQIIEAGMIEGGVYTLSWTGTAQARVYQGTPTGSYAASPVTTASLSAGANTTVEFNAGTVTRVKLEIGNVPTPYNRQSLAKSTADCQRYYCASGILLLAGYNAAGGSVFETYEFPVQMRAAPTIPAFVGSTLSNCSALAVSTTYIGNANINATVTATGAALAQFQMLASAEL
jgi:hypothetical protein